VYTLLGENRTKPTHKDNKFKHCREWLATTLLINSDGKTLVSAGLLASEIPLLAIVSLWSMVALFMFEGSLPNRLATLVRVIMPWLPFFALCTLLSPVAARLAQWGERSHGRGRLAATIALIPVMPVILGIFLTPSLFMMAPILGVMSIWLTGELWWQLFLLFLQRLATFDYWTQLDEESQPQGSDLLYEHRNLLETKKTALIERRLRWEDMARDHLQGASKSHLTLAPSQDNVNIQEEAASSTGLPNFLTRLWMPSWRNRPWAIILAISLLLGGIALWRLESKVTPGKAAITPEPPSLVFWYQTSGREAALLDELIADYNTLSSSESNNPLVQGYNQSGDLTVKIYHSQITGEVPDILLVPQELADQLHATTLLPLWPDRLWRHHLALVVAPTTKLVREAEAFAAYLQAKLNAY
jgi:hypothetical protein